MSDTIFGKIIAGDIHAPKVYEDEHCIVINDIQPQAPVHMLVIPRKPIPRLVDASADDQALLGHLMLVARQMAEEQGIGEGFRHKPRCAVMRRFFSGGSLSIGGQ